MIHFWVNSGDDIQKFKMAEEPRPVLSATDRLKKLEKAGTEFKLDRTVPIRRWLKIIFFFFEFTIKNMTKFLCFFSDITNPGLRCWGWLTITPMMAAWRKLICFITNICHCLLKRSVRTRPLALVTRPFVYWHAHLCIDTTMCVLTPTSMYWHAC